MQIEFHRQDQVLLWIQTMLKAIGCGPKYDNRKETDENAFLKALGTSDTAYQKCYIRVYPITVSPLYTCVR